MRNRPYLLPPEPWPSLINEFAMKLESENKSDRTIRNYTDSVRWLHLWLASPIPPPDVDDTATWLATVPAAPTEPGEYTERHVSRWLTYRRKTTSPGNANNNYRSLLPWFAWLEDEGEISISPMLKLKPPHVPDAPVPVTPVELIQRVLKDCDGRDFLDRRDNAIIRFFWDTGARLSEIANLELDDIDQKRRCITVTGKGGKVRVIPYSATTGMALARYLRVRPKHPYAETTKRVWLADFRRREPLSDNGIKIMLRRRGRAAGVNEEIGRNLHAHLGRHFESHQFLKNGGSEGDLMILNGWTTPQMARRYGASAASDRAHDRARELRVGDLL